LVCGVNIVDIELLKSHTKLSQGLTEKTNKVRWLWEILSEYSEEEKIKFVKFCWAQERLPSTHEEFEKLQVVFTIKSYIDKNRKDVFPRADTCFFSLELPEYSSKEVMKKLLSTAISFDNVSINADKVENPRTEQGGFRINQNLIQNDESDSEFIS
jgi:other hect domain ubiquitin protein ligase E3